MSFRTLASACLPCFALVLAGCGSKGGVTIAGSTFSIQDEISGALVDGTNDLTLLQLSSVTGTCAALGAGQKPKSAQTLTITLSQGGGQAASPGVFPVAPSMSGTGPVALVQYAETDADCLTVAQVHGLSGSVTLASAAGSGASGSADVTLDTEEHITFSFSTTVCGALGDAAGPTTCP